MRKIRLSGKKRKENIIIRKKFKRIVRFYIIQKKNLDLIRFFFSYEYAKLFLQYQWSPEQIVHRLKHEGFESIVSINTIYRSIYRGLFNSTISPNSKGAMMKLRHKNKRRKTKDYIEKRGQFPISHTIHDRSNEAELRSEIGHWEIDTVLGKQGRNCLVTLVDRKSRFLLAGRTTNKSSSAINHIISFLLDSLNTESLKSITSDRGSEFSGHSKITKKYNIEFYFSDPYSPWRRGTKENTNGLIREYIPKRKDIGDYVDEYIENFVDKINLSPRKCLNWLTPYEVFYGKLLNLT